MQITSLKIFPYLLAFFGFASFSVGDAAYKWLSDYSSVYTNAFISTFCAILIVLAYGCIRGAPLSFLRVEKRGWHIARGFAITAQFLFALFAFTALPLTTTYAILFCAPFWTAIVAQILLGEKITGATWLSIVIGFVGTLIVLRPDMTNISLAMISAILSSICIAFVNVLASKIGPQNDKGYSFAVYAIGTSALASGILCVFNGFAFDSSQYFAHIVTILSSLGGVAACAIAFTLAKASKVEVIHYSQIIWGVVFGWFLFGDFPDFWSWVGVGLIVASGVYLVTHEAKQKNGHKI